MGLTLIALFLLVAAMVFGLGLAFTGKGDSVKRLRQSLDPALATATTVPASKRGSRASLALIRDDLMSEIPALNRWLEQMGRGTALQRWLRQAALEIRPGKFLLLCLAFGMMGMALASPFLPGYGALLAVPLAGALPALWASRRRQKRLDRFGAQFPEAIDLLVRASRAGHPPASALELIATEMRDPIAGEFRQVFDQQRFGLPMRESLLNLTERVPLVDVQFFATAMIIQRESGGNLAEILDKLSHLIRERVQILREVKTYTAQGRMTLWVLLALAPIMLVLLLFIDRSLVMDFLSDPLGKAALMGAAGMQVVGYFLLNKIIAIKV